MIAVMVLVYDLRLVSTTGKPDCRLPQSSVHMNVDFSTPLGTPHWQLAFLLESGTAH